MQSTIKINLIYISILFFSDAGILFFLSFNQPILFLTNAGFIKSYFDSFYNEEIIPEESFNAWESGGEEEQGKGVAIATSSEFFRWLRNAAEEPWRGGGRVEQFIGKLNNRRLKECTP